MRAESQSRWRATHGLRTALTGLFVVVVGANSAEAIAYMHRIQVIDSFRAGTATVSDGRHADDLVHAAGLLGLGMVLVIAVVFIVWQWRTAKNAVFLGRPDERYSPGWSIGAWFIPLANLFIPVQIMQGLWRGSDPGPLPDDWRRGRRSALVGWWWASMIVSFLFGRWPADRSTLSGLRSADGRAIVGLLIASVGAVLALLVVRAITARQLALKTSVVDASSYSPGVRCASCGAGYVAGTAVCPVCSSTDLRPTPAP